MFSLGAGHSWWNVGWGHFTQANWFDIILTVDEIVGMTTCEGNKMKGNIINWDTENWTIYDTIGRTHSMKTSMESNPSLLNRMLVQFGFHYIVIQSKIR